MRKRIKLKSYPCVEMADIVWTYMGPPALKPALPALEWARVPAERRYASKRFQECNYLQAVEGGIDSSHVSFLHSGALKSDPLFVGSRGNRLLDRTQDQGERNSAMHGSGQSRAVEAGASEKCGPREDPGTA